MIRKVRNAAVVALALASAPVLADGTWDPIEGNWNPLKSDFKQQWADITDDSFLVLRVSVTIWLVRSR